jgi:trans-aconitate 2-methyltransferase
VLADAYAMVDWVRGTALTPYMERLGDEMAERFLAAYRAKVRAAFPGSPVFYPFRRTLFAASR